MAFVKTILLVLLFVTSCLVTANQPTNLPTTNAQRIVALAPHIVESLFDIGAGDKIVGTVEYSDHPAAALDIPRIGGYYGLQIEKILALNPDLIIVWRNGNKAEDIERLEKLNLPIVYSDPIAISGVADELRLFGKLTNRQQQAEQQAQKFETKLQGIQQRFSNKTPIAVFYQLWSQPLMSVNKNTWIHQLITTCGARNVFADSATDYPQLSIENVLLAKPELIVMPDEKADKPQPKIDWSKWSMIPAVKNNHFIRINADLVHRFSSRMLVGLQDMCDKIDKVRS